jgi:hypothetical protein
MHTYYSTIPLPDDAHSCCGLYLQSRIGEVTESEQLLLKPHFCKNNLPKTYAEFEGAVKAHETEISLMHQLSESDDRDNLSEDEEEGGYRAVFTPWLHTPISWWSKK